MSVNINKKKFFRLRRAVSSVSWHSWLREAAYKRYEKILEAEVSARSLPEHVAIIMDGNRRYARKIGLSTEDGYEHGTKTTERVVEWCFEIGVQQLSLYAFSIENFRRSEEEKEYLFELLRLKLEKLSRDERIHKNEIRTRVIGNLNLLPKPVKAAIRTAEDATAQYNRFKLFIAVAYSGRMEIVDAVRLIANKVKSGLLKSDTIDEDTISKHLYISRFEGGENANAAAASLCGGGAKMSVDLIIRTGGEMRLSNFLPWQTFGNECTAYFCAPFWPEFRRIDLLRAIRTYQERDSEDKNESFYRN